MVSAAGDIAAAMIGGMSAVLLEVVSHYLAQVRAQELQEKIAEDQRKLGPVDKVLYP